MKLLLLFSLCAFSLLVGQSLYFFRDGFSPRHIQTNIQSLSTCTIDEETKQILSHPFYYLGRGRQCFAFASKDGKYVLKILRTDTYKIPFWARALNLYEKRREKKSKKNRFVFESFRIAKEELQEITGTIALHLGKSLPAEQQITIVDALGFPHHLPLQSTLFILQHKRPLWAPAFLAAQKNKDVKQQQILLNSFVDLVVERAQKGIINRDESFLPNYGFEDGKSYQIDIGDFYRDQRCSFQKAVHDSLRPLQEWLAETDPPMLAYLNSQIENLQ